MQWLTQSLFKTTNVAAITCLIPGTGWRVGGKLPLDTTTKWCPEAVSSMFVGAALSKSKWNSEEPE